MRQAVEDIDAGKVSFTAEDDADTARQADLAAALEKEVMALAIAFAQRHEGIEENFVTVAACLTVAATAAMAGEGMGPDDFAELARAVARQGHDQAQATRRRAKARGKA